MSSSVWISINESKAEHPHHLKLPQGTRNKFKHIGYVCGEVTYLACAKQVQGRGRPRHWVRTTCCHLFFESARVIQHYGVFRGDIPCLCQLGEAETVKAKAAATMRAVTRILKLILGVFGWFGGEVKTIVP